MAVSAHAGMGALPYQGGVAFRVWAPFASAVAVAGSFNGWNAETDRLTLEGNGYWSADVPAASPGDEYKLVIENAGRRLWKNDPYARAMTNSVGNSIVTDPAYPWKDRPYSTPPWNELVIYELHVGSFRFDRSSGAPRRGNFDSVISRLDYLQDLGVNALQVMPADEFPGEISWGYNPAQIFAIEESYGGPSGFRRLVEAAHDRGLAVIFDVVYNHLGPMDLDLWQFDGWSPSGRDDEGGIYFYNDWREQTPWGDTRPDYGRPEVRQYLRDNALSWLLEHRCDGLRWDATGWIRNVWGSNDDPGSDLPDGWALMQRVNAEIGARQPWKITIAEDMQENEWITKDTAAGGAGFGAQWGARFMHTVREAVIAREDGGRSMPALGAVVGQRFNGNAFQRVVYTESHDEVAESAGQARVPELIWPGQATSFFSQKRSTLAAALVFTAPGIPMIFMGQEFLEAGSWSDARELDWSKAEQFAGIRLLYRDLIRLRRNGDDRSRGLQGHGVNVHHVNDRDKVVAFHRFDRGGPGDDVLVVLNFANRSYDAYRLGVPRGGRWRVRVNSDWPGYSPDFAGHPSDDTWASPGGNADGMPFAAEVSLGPYTALVLSQDE